MWRKFCIIIAVAFGVSGCIGTGFKPVYDAQKNKSTLHSIYVASMEGEFGVYLRSVLVELLPLKGVPKYKLVASFSSSEKDLAITRDSSVTRKQVIATVRYSLYKYDGTTKPIFYFVTTGKASYGSASTPYLGDISRNSAIKRALDIAAENSVFRVKEFFLKKQDTTGNAMGNTGETPSKKAGKTTVENTSKSTAGTSTAGTEGKKSKK